MEIKYKIQRMEESGFYIKPDIDDKTIDLLNIEFQLSHNLSFNASNEEVILKMFVEMTPKDSNDVLAKDDVYCVFKVMPFDKVIKINDAGFSTSNSQLIDTFISVAIGTLRGLLLKNLKGTPLNGCVLPLVPMQIIRQSSKFETN